MVQQQIQAALDEVSETKILLAEAKKAGDEKEVDFLRDRLKSLDTRLLRMLDEKNFYLGVHQGGEHCSYVPHLPHCYLCDPNHGELSVNGCHTSTVNLPATPSPRESEL